MCRDKGKFTIYLHEPRILLCLRMITQKQNLGLQPPRIHMSSCIQVCPCIHVYRMYTRAQCRWYAAYNLLAHSCSQITLLFSQCVSLSSEQHI